MGADTMERTTRPVQEAFARVGKPFDLQVLPDSARTAPLAANAIGCDVAQIAKSIVFQGEGSGQAVLVVASGANRISEARVAEHVGETVHMASPGRVREVTGFAIGGVPPCGHATRIPVVLDRCLLDIGTCWAAAGRPETIVRIESEWLPELTGGVFIDVV